MMKMMMTTTCRASSRLVFLLAMVALACTTCASFTATSKMTFQSARAVPGAMAQFKRTAGVLRQSDEGSEPENKNKPMPTSGTYYDDEVRKCFVTASRGLPPSVDECVDQHLIRARSCVLLANPPSLFFDRR